MTTAARIDAAELVRELRGLAERLPVPGGTWHPYVPLIAACRADLERAIESAATQPEALALFEALAAEETEAEFDPEAPEELTAAWLRLEALPIPEGQHPYLDDILPALEALRLLLVALSRPSPAAERGDRRAA